MDIVVIGTSEFTLKTAQAVQASGERLLAIISMPAHSLPLNSTDIKAFAKTNGICYEEFEDLNAPDAVAVLRKLSPDYIISSWPKILKKEALNVSKCFVIGSHPTDLPYNRGRHPFHWMIVQGISHTVLTFFRMDEGVDTGNILHKVLIKIDKDDTIIDLLTKVNTAAYRGTMELLKILVSQPGYEGTGQDHAKANYWRRRTPYDITLDFRMAAAHIVRTINSFTRPYPCANLIFEGKVLKVLRATVAPGIFSVEELERIEPGKIISVEGYLLKVKSADEIVELQMSSPLPPRIYEVKYIHPPMKYFSEYFGDLSTEITGEK